jgi:hypothetical protein
MVRACCEDRVGEVTRTISARVFGEGGERKKMPVGDGAGAETQRKAVRSNVLGVTLAAA